MISLSEQLYRFSIIIDKLSLEEFLFSPVIEEYQIYQMKKYTLTFINPMLEEQYQEEQREVMIQTFQYYFKILICSNIINVSYWLWIEQYYNSLWIIIPTIVEFIVQHIVYQEKFRKHFRFFLHILSFVFTLQQIVWQKYPIQLFIIHQIVVQLLSSQHFIENSLSYLFFIAIRIYIQDQFTILELCIIVNSAFYLQNQYITCLNARNMFLQKQTNELWKRGLEESKTAMIILKYTDNSRRFEQVFANQEMNKILIDNNDFLKNLYTLDNKECIRSYLYNHYIKPQKVEQFEINSHFNKIYFKITGATFRINQFKFILQIQPLDYINSAIITNYKILYTELLNPIKNYNQIDHFKQLYIRESMKIIISQLFQGGYIFQSSLLSEVQQVKKMFNPIQVISDRVFSIQTDLRLLFLLGSLINCRTQIDTIKIQQINEDELKLIIHLEVLIDIQPSILTLNKIIDQIGKKWHYNRRSRELVVDLINQTYQNFK